MGTGERPVTDREFKAVLKRLGFEPRSRNGSSHEQWVKGGGATFRRVTVDSHHSPYHRNLLRLMLNQAGITKADFFRELGKI